MSTETALWILVFAQLAALTFAVVVVEKQHRSLKEAYRLLSPFDHDGDGKPGGSRRKA